MKPVLADAVIAEAEPADPRVNVQIVLECTRGRTRSSGTRS